MRKKLGLLVIPCLAFLSIGPVTSAGAAADPPAQANDTCFGKHPTIIKWTYDAVLKTRVIQGTSGNDVIIATDAADYIYGNGGNDIICARGGNDNVVYGSQAGVVQVDLGGGDDMIWDDYNGGLATLYLYGGPGNDRFWASNGDAYLFGGPGNFDFYGGSGWTDCYNNGGVGTAASCKYFDNSGTALGEAQQ